MTNNEDETAQPPSIGERIEQMVAQSDVVANPTALASLIGKNSSLVSRWIKNQRMPSAEDLVKVAACLELTPDQLLGFDGGLFEVPKSVAEYIEAHEDELEPEVRQMLERMYWTPLGEPSAWAVENIATTLAAEHAARQAQLAQAKAEQAAAEAAAARDRAIAKSRISRKIESKPAPAAPAAKEQTGPRLPVRLSEGPRRAPKRKTSA